MTISHKTFIAPRAYSKASLYYFKWLRNLFTMCPSPHMKEEEGAIRREAKLKWERGVSTRCYDLGFWLSFI